MGPLITLLAVIFLIWYLVVLGLAYNGFFEILSKFSMKSRQDVDRKNAALGMELEGITILRPLKGIDPEMELCLSSCFEQDYPTEKLEIIFCVQDPADPAVRIAEEIIKKYPHIDSKILIDDPNNKEYYGPNPKVNNLAKGYKKAKYDILWILDSNVWTRPDTLRRSVYALSNSTDNGRQTYDFKTQKGRRVNLVHHVPLAVSATVPETTGIGTKLDEMFLGTSHSKFYVSLNKVAVAPCVNGKSNLYRRSELDLAVYRMGEKSSYASSNGQSGDGLSDAKYYSMEKGNGIRFFARYIGEDNMIGIALWDYCHGRTGMTGDCVAQPLSGGEGKNQIGGRLIDYFTRRMRWLRVRKYMVLAATLLEPSTECLCSGLFGTFAVSVLFLDCKFSLLWFLFHIFVWFSTDFFHFHYIFQSIRSGLQAPPFFLKESFNTDSTLKGYKVKSFKEFVPIWLARELLAFPVWFVAVVGSKIDWRGQNFRIKADLSAERL